MITLPAVILEPFDQMLESKSLSGNTRVVYIKWLRFYWDFCHKYQHVPFSRESLRLFLTKLTDKQQSEDQRKQAYQAVSLFFSMWAAANKAASQGSATNVVSNGNGRIIIESPRTSPRQTGPSPAINPPSDHVATQSAQDS